MNNNPIGIFDSGVGGLSILASVKKLLPDEHFVYLADQKHNPYGGRSVAEIQELSSKVVSFLVQKKVKLIIVACNTVSVNAIEHLRAQFSVPIVAVVPVVKTIAEKSKTKKAAVFSTPATAKSQYLQRLIKQFGGDTTIYTVGTSKLEHLVEEGIVDGPKIREAIEESVLPLLEQQVDTLALGCTHYPFLTPAIKEVVGDLIAIYDSGGAIARRVQYILEKESLAATSREEDRFYTTGDALLFHKIAEKLLQSKLKNVENSTL